MYDVWCQFWQCQDFESFSSGNPSLTVKILYLDYKFAATQLGLMMIILIIITTRASTTTTMTQQQRQWPRWRQLWWWWWQWKRTESSKGSKVEATQLKLMFREDFLQLHPVQRVQHRRRTFEGLIVTLRKNFQFWTDGVLRKNVWRNIFHQIRLFWVSGWISMHEKRVWTLVALDMSYVWEDQGRGKKACWENYPPKFCRRSKLHNNETQPS